MKIVTLGRGNVGGGLAQLWREAGHDVTELGSGGGDASGAEALLLAVPSGSIADALGKVEGLGGDVPIIDATNLIRGERPDGHGSLAEYVRALTGNPVAKSFCANFARLYERVGETAPKPGNVFAADPGAKGTAEELIRAAGYEPVYAGGLDKARAIEDFLGILFAVAGERGPFFYSFSAGSGAGR